MATIKIVPPNYREEYAYIEIKCETYIEVNRIAAWVEHFKGVTFVERILNKPHVHVHFANVDPTVLLDSIVNTQTVLSEAQS